MIKSFVSCLFIITILFSANAQTPWPTGGWQKASPKSLGLNEDSLISLDKVLASGAYGNIDGLLVTRHGKIAYEKYYSHDYAAIYKEEVLVKSALNNGDPGGPYNYFNPWWHPWFHGTRLHTLQSVTKTITSVVIGVAITRHEFPALNTPVLQFFDTSRVQNIDDRKRRMTIRDLLTMTAGLQWNENLPYADPNNDGSNMEAACDWVQYTINRPMSDEPGKRFNYNSGATELLAYIFRMATGHDLEEYAAANLFKPLGITDYYWKRTPSGLADSEGGLYLAPTDLAKIFYLYLHSGEWESKILVSRDYVQASVTPYVAVDEGLSYGYKWWLSSYGKTPAETVWRGSGFGGQLPMIFRQYDIVVVVNAWDILPGMKGASSNFIIRKILQAVEGYPEPVR